MPPINTTLPQHSRAPLHLCAITLDPHRNPVASPDGIVFEGNTIRQLVRRTRLNPINGRALSPNSLVPLKFSLDPRTSLPRCPILFHSFHQNIKIVAVATTGNVYSYTAIQRLNIQQRDMTDLLDRTPFTMDDIIVLFDPQHHFWSTEPQDSHRVQSSPELSPLSHPSSSYIASSHPLASTEHRNHPIPAPLRTHSPHPPRIPRILPAPPISPSASTHLSSPPPSNADSSSYQYHQPHIRPLTAHPNQRNPLDPPTPQLIHSCQLPMRYHPPNIHPPAFPPTPSPYSLIPSSKQVNPKRIYGRREEPSAVPKKPRLHPAVLPARSKPPVRPAVERDYPATDYSRRKKAEEERKAVYKRVRKGRKGKGYVRVVTNVGHLNIELHCDKVPLTCDNFLSLAESKYYDGLKWHRVIPGFIAQTGDPSGTGQGGDSFWGGYFKDEIRTSLVHDSAGTVSMASSGRDTNLSQWFICLDAAPHLDGSNTVFGKVVGGLFVLKKIESEAEMNHPLTVETIEVLVNPIRQVREQIAKTSMVSAVSTANTPLIPAGSRASPLPGNTQSSLSDRTQEGVPVSEFSRTQVQGATIHPRPDLSTPCPAPEDHQQTTQDHLPSAKTLLTTANVLPRSN